MEQWKELCALCKKNGLIPFFDCAYLGLGRGLQEDGEAMRHFFSEGLEFLAAVSNAKNMALYGERTGSLFVVSKSEKTAAAVMSRLKQIVRANYTSPPIHGARIAARILAIESLRAQWEGELAQMRERIQRMRILLEQELTQRKTGIDFTHLSRGLGMFGFTGLNPSQVARLKEEYGIYMPETGRINLCGLNVRNIGYVADAISAVIP